MNQTRPKTRVIYIEALGRSIFSYSLEDIRLQLSTRSATLDTRSIEQRLDRPEPVPTKTSGLPTYAESFTKGLEHDRSTGLVARPKEYRLLIESQPAGQVPLPPTPPRYITRRSLWRSQKARTDNAGQGAGLRSWETYGIFLSANFSRVDLPPHPCIGSHELTAEMAEVYAQALLRDLPFAAMQENICSGASDAERRRIDAMVTQLNQLTWFGTTDPTRHRQRGPASRQTVFRGLTPGDSIGPYLSQFLLVGNRRLDDQSSGGSLPKDGRLHFGAISIDQRVRHATPGDDHMTEWEEWLDIQNGADLRNLESYQPTADPDTPARRFLTTPRDLATHVHQDALYEPYLNACLLLLSYEATRAPRTSVPKLREGTIDGPRLLSLITEVATEALQTVRFQKFSTHRRARPEAIAARIEKASQLSPRIPGLQSMVETLHSIGILEGIKSRTEELNGTDRGTYLLPMAFCEGSPMHPGYGSSHATVAGACVTLLKAFFDPSQPLDAGAGGPGRAYVANRDGSTLLAVDVEDSQGEATQLTVGGELDKLASNLSAGRSWAGLQTFSDSFESIRLGESIALDLIARKKESFGPAFSCTIPLFDGGLHKI